MRTTSGSSDMSDEVFLSCNSDVGTIFDREGAGSPKPPPRRKKRPPEPETSPEKVKEILKQIEDLTLKAQEDDVPISDSSPVINIIAPTSVERNKIVVADNKENRHSNGGIPTPEKPPLTKEPVTTFKSKVKMEPKSKVNELTQKCELETEFQRSRSLRMPDPEKKERNPVQKSNSLKSSETARGQKSEVPPKVQPEAAPASTLARNNSLKRAQEFEAKMQQQSTYSKPVNVGVALQRSNSQKRIQEFEQKAKKPPMHPEPRCAPPPTTTAIADPPPPPTKVHEPVFAQNFSVQLVERKTFYLEITRDSVVVLPLVSQEIRDLIVDEAIAQADLETSLTDSLLDGTSLDTSASEEQASLEESFRSRKGSNGSDIVAWKQDLKQIWNSDEEEEPFHTARQVLVLLRWRFY